ncbi:MAG TPA: helix-turn-helix transcriptional regulator [Solirubrobacterales bacterium]|nr:helix-turn-helix transcriptional regulator [Solirubrobacterales bacterium]
MTYGRGLGANLRQARIAKGLTQEELADRSRMHPTAISKLERGETIPRADNLQKLADVLATTLEELRPPMHWDEERGEFVERPPD